MGEELNKLKNGTKLMFKEFFNKDTNKKQRANMLTFSRLLIGPIVPILMALGLPAIATVTVLVGCFTDFLDGRCARKYNSSSEYGARLDQVVDKLFAGFVGIALSILNPAFLITILGEALISATNIGYKIKYDKLNIKSSIVGKIKQWPLALAFASGFLTFVIPTLSSITAYLLTITVLLQTFTLGSYVIKNNQEVKRMEKSKKANEVVELKNDEEKTLSEKICVKKKLKNRKEYYKELRNTLNQVLGLENDQEKAIQTGYQKIKKWF